MKNSTSAVHSHEQLRERLAISLPTILRGRGLHVEVTVALDGSRIRASWSAIGTRTSGNALFHELGADLDCIADAMERWFDEEWPGKAS